jgi:hypothetical protein
VKDESGEPVFGARVQVFRYRSQLGQRRLMPVVSVQTDDLGQYRLANFGPGDYYISVQRTPPSEGLAAVRAYSFVDNSAEQLAGQLNTPAPANTQTVETITGPLPSEPETDYVPMWYPSAAEPSAATAVRLAAGATAGNIDMTWRKSRVVRIRGKVADAAGGAVGAPILTLTPKGAQAPPLNAGNMVVARDGSFEISAVPPGSYWLTARPGSMASGGGQASGVVFTSGPAGSTRMAVQSIEVKDSPIEGVQLVLSAGRAIKGSVKMEGGGPLVQPVFLSLVSQEPGARVSIRPGNDGTFTATGVFPLIYALDAQNLPANSYVKSIRFAGRDVPGTGLEFTGDGELEVVLSNTGAVLEGSVTGAGGRPAGLAGMVVAPVAGSAPVRTGNADANGNFYFANLPPGDYRVLAWDAAAPEASDPPESLGPSARYAKTLTLGANGHEKVQVTALAAAR